MTNSFSSMVPSLKTRLVMITAVSSSSPLSSSGFFPLLQVTVSVYLVEKAMNVLLCCLESKEMEARCMGASALWALLHNNQRVQRPTHTHLKHDSSAISFIVSSHTSDCFTLSSLKLHYLPGLKLIKLSCAVCLISPQRPRAL